MSDTDTGMSQSNVQLVRRVYEALNVRDWDEVFRHTDPAFEMTTPRGLNAGTVRRREGAEKFLKDYIASFSSVSWEPERFFDRDNHVVALVTTRGRPRGGSIDIVTRNGHLWTIRNGTIGSMETFPDPKEALAVVGLH